MQTNKVVALDCANREHVQAAADLHRRLLGDSPVPRMGYRFMTRFYYSKLVEAGLIKCDLYRHRDRYVGLSVYTKYPCSFMEKGKRRYFFYLLFLLAQNLVLHPWRIGEILKARRINRRRKLKPGDDKTGDLLSFGVLETYKYLKDEATGLRISNLLFERAMDYFKQQGFLRMQGEIKRENKPSLFLWRAYSGTIKACDWSKNGEYLVSIDL